MPNDARMPNWDAIQLTYENEIRAFDPELPKDPFEARFAFFAKMLLRQGASLAAMSALGKGATVAGLGNLSVSAAGLSTSVVPIVWALKPWLSAASVAGIATNLDKIYALNEPRYALKFAGGTARYHAKVYPCTCAAQSRTRAFCVVAKGDKKQQVSYSATCKDIIDFVKEQSDAKAAKIAVNATVVGIPFYMLYALGRSIYKRASGTIHSARTTMAQALVTRATPEFEYDARKREVKIRVAGCRQAQALTALLVGELDLESPKEKGEDYPLTLGALFCPDGWESVYRAMSAGVVW